MRLDEGIYCGMKVSDFLQIFSNVRHMPKRGWWVIVSVCLIAGLLLSGLVYSERHQIHQLIKDLTLPPARPVQITPLALTPGTSSVTPTPLTSGDWTTYHKNNSRTGYVPTMPNPGTLTRLWQRKLDGAVYAEPLVVGDRLIVATEHDSVYALSAQTGQILWHTS